MSECHHAQIITPLWSTDSQNFRCSPLELTYAVREFSIILLITCLMSVLGLNCDWAEFVLMIIAALLFLLTMWVKSSNRHIFWREHLTWIQIENQRRIQSFCINTIPNYPAVQRNFSVVSIHQKRIGGVNKSIKFCFIYFQIGHDRFPRTENLTRSCPSAHSVVLRWQTSIADSDWWLTLLNNSYSNDFDLSICLPCGNHDKYLRMNSKWSVDLFELVFVRFVCHWFCIGAIVSLDGKDFSN